MAAIRSASMTVVRSTTRLLTTTAKFQHAQQSAPQALRRPVTLRLLHASACSAAKADSSHSRHGHRNPKKELLDFYKILGVGHNASHADIKTAFRELAKEHHPDMGNKSSDPAFFKVIAEAYSTLSNEHKRMQYDEKVEDLKEKFAKKNEKYAQAGGGAAYSRWGDTSVGSSGSAATNTASYRGAMANTLHRMKEDAYIRGRVKRMHRARVDVPSQGTSLVSLTLPSLMVAFAVVMLGTLLLKGNTQAAEKAHAQSVAAARAGAAAAGAPVTSSISGAEAAAAAEETAATARQERAKWTAQGNKVFGV